MKTAEELADQLVQLYSHQGVTALAATELRRLSTENAELRTLHAQGQTLLASDHRGMRVDYTGLLGQCQALLKKNESGYAEMLRQLQDHMQELGKRWYAGDTAVVDEILQLYCIEKDARKALKKSQENQDQQTSDANRP